MTAELIALTEELHATRLMLGTVIERLDAADRRAADLEKRAKRHRYASWLLAACLLAVTALGVAFYSDQQNDERQECEERRSSRLILRELVELSDDGDGFNLTGIESFNQLDPETQQYLRDLEAASRQAPDPSAFVRDALALLDIPNCS